MTSLSGLPPPLGKPAAQAVAANTAFDDDGWADEWDFEDLEKPSKDKGDEAYNLGIDIDSKQYQNENLNKLSD